MYEEQHFTRDAARASFDESADGITVDDDDVSVDWDDVETVTIDDPPHAQAFGTKDFYKLPATVARPIPQPYQYGEDSVVWLKKPREGLKDAAWSLENAPWTMDHPDTGMVKNVDDVRGFWSDPRYVDGLDDLDADLHVPTDDEEAKEFIEENGDVSVGFYNRITEVSDYDGVVGGEDDADVDLDGYQTDMIFDHVASVAVGRCPSEQGCGIDSHSHGHIDNDFKSGTNIIHKGDGEEGAHPDRDDMTVDGGGEVDGQWYAVPSEDTTGDEPKYPIDSCSDVQDAWHLRGHGEGLKIEQSTLENRIKRRAEALGCDVPGEDTDDSLYEIAPMCNNTEDCGCNNETDNTMDINIDDLAVDAALAKIRSQHDGVDERLDELEAYADAAEQAEDAADELGLDGVEDLADSVSVLQEQKEELEQELDEARRPQMEEDAAAIADMTDRFGDDAEAVIDELGEDPQAVADKRELVEDLVDGYSETTANADTGSESSTSTVDGYAHTPWDN